MQFSKSTDYALHALIHLAQVEGRNNIGVKELSAILSVSESYLSKIMSKLRKEGIVRAVSGVKGGYELAKTAEEITFLEVIQAIEGRQQMFECSNLNSKQHQLLAELHHIEAKVADRGECLVKKVMDGAEQHLHQYLREHTIQFILDQATKRCNYSINKK
ncbi:RrF2 family transcriptional regulator [Amphibacillus jilinensis]|uniref:RrF2 family transcriptional regulator n=1 Tax=Amphibacillus jilinensis TaxID=1216008 RepID=UPI0002DE9849|nr:Rrf2 family transcriptional regulator [Amphibacillus jilinensis]